MPDRIVFADQARHRLLAGIDKLAMAISPTLGPTGLNVAVDGRSMAGTKRYGPPQVIAQGQRIIRDLELPDRFENMGVELLKQAAKQTDDMVGDGTSTTVLLACAMIVEGVKNIAAGANPMMLKRGMERAVRNASQAVASLAKPVRSADDIRQVMSSASGSAEIAEALGWAIDEIGMHGLMMVERYPKSLGIVIECVHGFQFERGLLSHYFVTDSGEEAIHLEQPYILLTDEDVTDADDLLPLLQELRELPAHDLLVIAPEMKDGPLGLLITNHRRDVIHCAAVRPPSYGTARAEMLEDLAIFTGATIISQKRGCPLRLAGVAQLGRADAAHITGSDTTIVEGHGDKGLIESRIAELDRRADAARDPNDRASLERRVAQLGGGLARVQVGGGSEAEMENLVELVESALASMRATLAEGIVPGAGTALIHAAEAIESPSIITDEATGMGIVRRALQEPLRQIARNVGQDEAVVVATVQRMQREANSQWIGFDAQKGVCCDLSQQGIVDPCKTVRTALHNAASCAMMILTTNVLALGPRKRQP